MKILVLGCNGMAGHLISLYFKEKGHEVVGFARQQSQLLDSTIIGDASDMALIKKVIEEGNYDAVINCIGLLNQFAENNKAMAVLLNGYLPHYLVELTKDTKTRILHMSTDCVFAGNDGPYYEDTLPNGASFYDRSKAMGEINNDKDLTVRNSIIMQDAQIQEGAEIDHCILDKQSVIRRNGRLIAPAAYPIVIAKNVVI